MKTIARTLGVACSTPTDRLADRTKELRRYHKAQDAALLPILANLRLSTSAIPGCGRTVAIAG